MNKVYGSFDTVATKDGKIKISGYANTVDRDRVGDVITESAWKSKSALTNYTKNPIILAFHDHSLPIGKMIDFDITPKGLWIEAEIDDSEEKIYKKIKNGILKTFSVGFRVLDADFKEETDTFYIKDLELLEVSVVSVPANQESVFNLSKSAKKDFAAMPEDYKTSKNAVREAILENSGVLQAIATLPEGAKFSLQPYTEYGSKAIKQVKVGITTGLATAILTEETEEDSTFFMRGMLNDIMRNEATIKAEEKLVALLKYKAGTSSSKSSGKTWGSVVDMYKGLKTKVLRTAGQLYFFTSIDTATEIMESRAYYQSSLRDKIKVIGTSELTDEDAILAHSHGLFGRLEFNRGVEVEKLLPSDATKHYLGFRYGLEVDTDYCVKKTLS